MFRNMVTSLIKYGKIKTTDAKAKELRRWGDKLVTLAKRGDLHARRQALAIVTERAVVNKLFDEAPEKFGNVSGGYTRVIKLGRRPGDAAAMSLIEFVTFEEKRKAKSKKKAKKPAPETDTSKAIAGSDEVKKDSDTRTLKDNIEESESSLSETDADEQPSEEEPVVDNEESAKEDK